MVGTILAYVKWNGICRRGLDSCDSVVDSCKSFPVPLQTGRRNNLNIWAAAVFSNNTSIYRSQYDTNTTRGYWGAYLRTAGWRIVCVCVCVCVYIQRERERERGGERDSYLVLDEWHCARLCTKFEHSNEDNISAGTQNTRQMNPCVLKNLNVYAGDILALWPWWLTDE